MKNGMMGVKRDERLTILDVPTVVELRLFPAFFSAHEVYDISPARRGEESKEMAAALEIATECSWHRRPAGAPWRTHPRQHL